MSMADSESKKKWDKDNVLFVTTKLFKEYKGDRNDQDIIDFLDGKQRSTVIKLALREYIANHPND